MSDLSEGQLTFHRYVDPRVSRDEHVWLVWQTWQAHLGRDRDLCDVRLKWTVWANRNRHPNLKDLGFPNCLHSKNVVGLARVRVG